MRFYIKRDVTLKKKSLLSEKSLQVLSFCKMKNVEAYEIGWLALQKKKIVLTMRTTGTNDAFCSFKMAIS